VSEQRREVSECLDRYGLTPIELLAEHVVLDPHWNLIHATHAMANEMDLMVRCGVTTVLCPLTEAYLGDGIFDARRLVSEGGRFAIGSDSNVRIDAVEELRMLEYSQRLRHEQRACLASEAGLGRSLWSAAATGLPVGRLAPGAYADIVVLEQDNAERACLTVDGSLDALVTAGGAPDIAAVYVGGRQAVQSGRHGRDEEIDRAFAATLARLRNRL
jgi:formimidoylglutamate deiminase